MLTKDDLQAIEGLVTGIVDKKIDPIAKDLKDVKNRVRKIEKNVDVMAKAFDKADVTLEKRVKRIEGHLSLPKMN